MRRVLLITIILAGAAGWWLFGWETSDSGSLGVIEVHRFFGRATKVTLDANRDGRPDVVVRYPWSTLHVGSINAPCGDPFFTVMVEDRDLDGTWDTWTSRPRSPDADPCRLLIEADTTGNGEPDWSREIDFGESGKARQELEEFVVSSRIASSHARPQRGHILKPRASEAQPWVTKSANTRP